IGKLPQVVVPQTEVDQIAENAASSTSERLGFFISAWRELEANLMEQAGQSSDQPLSFRQLLDRLQKMGAFEKADFERLQSLRHFRNHVVHSAGHTANSQALSTATEDLHQLLDTWKRRRKRKGGESTDENNQPG